VAGPAIAIRGLGSSSVAVHGIEPASYARILDLSTRLVAGSVDLAGSNALIGTELAAKLGIGDGDRLRLQPGDGEDAVFTVAGVFDLGSGDLNERWVFVSLRAAQAMFGLEGGVSTIEVTG